MTHNMLIAIALIAAYPFIVWIISPILCPVLTIRFRGKKSFDPYLWFLVSFILCLVFFAASFFISRQVFGTAWWALLIAVPGVAAIFSGVIVRKIRDNIPHTRYSYTSDGDLHMEEKFGWFWEKKAWIMYHPREGTVDWIKTYKDGIPVCYKSFYRNGQVESEGYFNKGKKTELVITKRYNKDGTEKATGNGSDAFKQPDDVVSDGGDKPEPDAPATEMN